ncbi:MAG: OadG family protein [Clostridia bacterium]|nr:OadG family protein [Clostridia bacterium]
MLTNIALSAAKGDIPNWFAVTMGIGTVFVGLIAIIIICLITGAICSGPKNNKKTVNKSTVNGDKSVKDTELVAAVCAVCAEEMGKDVNSLRVVSFKKI